jgi:hypothetical protein
MPRCIKFEPYLKGDFMEFMALDMAGFSEKLKGMSKITFFTAEGLHRESGAIRSIEAGKDFVFFQLSSGIGSYRRFFSLEEDRSLEFYLFSASRQEYIQVISGGMLKAVILP